MDSTLPIFAQTVNQTAECRLQNMKENLLQRGMLKRVVKGKVLFLTTYKYVVNGDISKEKQQLTELQKMLKEFQSKRELYQQMLSAKEEGIASNEFKGDVL
jgi:hypothetical protein